MATIVDWSYYSSLHTTITDETEFDKAEPLAEQDVRSVVGPVRWAEITTDTFGYDVLKDCICKVIDKNAQDERSGKGKGVTSVSNDGYSESYASQAQTREALTEELNGCIRQWLSGTGLVGAY